VYGQCQEYSLDFKDTEDPEGCHKFCGKNDECNWWSWEPAFKLCILYSNCTAKGVDPPNVEACGDCISGEKLCPARECHGAFKCKGDFVDSFAIATLEECIEKCNHVEDCKWFTLEKKNDHCILYEECHNQFDCETCATGEKKCANGYKGTTPAPAVSQGPNNLDIDISAETDALEAAKFPPPNSECADNSCVDAYDGQSCWVCFQDWTLEGQYGAGCSGDIPSYSNCLNHENVFGTAYLNRKETDCEMLNQHVSSYSNHYYSICMGNWAAWAAYDGR
jgi:hypothetical protein